MGEKVIKAGVIGTGRIGNELLTRLAAETQAKWQIKFTASTKKIRIAISDSLMDGGRTYSEQSENSVSNLNKQFAGVDIVFLAISTKDDGKVEYELLKEVIDSGIPVVTCAKGGLGNYWPELEFNLPVIGHDASVGGGTMMLSNTKARLDSFVYGMLVILNGTINFFMDGIDRGDSPDQVVEEAARNRYIEPLKKGEKLNVLNVLNGEVVGDIPMKTAVFCNHVLGIRLRAKELSVTSLDFPRVKFLASHADKYRYFVSFEKKGLNSFGYGDDPEIGNFSHEANGWVIKGGFRKLIPQLGILKIPGVTNIVVADEGPYGYNVIARGRGAGPGPTVTTMIRNAYEKLKIDI